MMKDLKEMMMPIYLEVDCRICGKTHRLLVDETDYNAWLNGTCIQNAMPYLTADERELLISHTCGDCWAEMFNGIGGD